MSALIYIVLTPFLSALLLGMVYLLNPLKERYYFYSRVGILAALATAVLSLIIGWEMSHLPPDFVMRKTALEWIAIGEFKISFAFMADRLSAVMISFITVIGTLIHIYAAGYMKGDPGFGKFFAFFNLFLGSMLLLVLADNPIIMFIGWELVGLSSYLLIGFYHQVSANMQAANKAFILNRIGDFGFIMGLSLLFVSLEGNGYTFDAIKAHLGLIDQSTLVLIGGLLFVGAMGKSAQIPLYVWLPDAMAGPTPVSALIHAATMVTAGVYMVARFGFLYNEIPSIGELIAYVGAFSALFAAIIAMYQSDIKKILAYSTMSQLGYMFIAVGLGAYSSGIFHVFTHAFFKALLFMGAGAVIIAMHHEQNIFKMGGLDKRIRLVYFTMMMATLAISGFPPFSGFYSKDAILATAFASGHHLIWIMGTATALLTAFYMFRLFFTVFCAPARKEQPLQQLPMSMKWPLVVLAFGSVSAGWLGMNEAYGGSNWFTSFIALPDSQHHLSHTAEYLLGTLNVLMGVTGVLLAWNFFGRGSHEPEAHSIWLKMALNKFYVDELYEELFVRPLQRLSLLTERLIDQKGFDGFIHLVASSYKGIGGLFVRLQNGRVRYYALYILAGVAVMSLAILDVTWGM